MKTNMNTKNYFSILLASALILCGGTAWAKKTLDRVSEELSNIFDVDNTATVVEPIEDEDGATIGHKVILGQNYGPLAFSNDFGAVTIDLNGWLIKGTDGADGSETMAGTSGGPAMVIDGASGAAAGATAISVTNTMSAVPTDENGFDTTVENTEPYCSTTFVPGDYCIVDLATGAVSEMKNVQSADTFNTDEYKTAKMAFRYVPAGKFKAKCALDKGYRDFIENDVELSSYWIAIFPVTEAQWNLIVKNESSENKNPKSLISWNNFRGGEWNGTSGEPGSSTFVGMLNAKVAAAGYGNKFDLTTSFQWERAARAGTRTEYFFTDTTAAWTRDSGNNRLEVEGDASKSLSTYAWYGYNNKSPTGVKVVGGKLPNAWGIYDLYGNLWEWCLDWHASLSDVDVCKDYGGPASGTTRLVRGGHYNDMACYCSSVNRESDSPSSSGYFGFRIVMTFMPPTIAGGKGGDGNPPGLGNEAIVDGDGNPIAVEDTLGFVAKGEDGEYLKSPAQVALEGIFDTANTPTVIELMHGADGAFVGYKVILGKDYGPLAFSNDFGKVTIDLNGWTIKGADGVDSATGLTAGANGGAAIVIDGNCGADAGDTAITVKDDSGIQPVQLWENGPYFAKCNVGANAPQESGYYFWWGDTVGYTQNVSKTGWVSVNDEATPITFDDTVPANSTRGQNGLALKTLGYVDDDANPALNAEHDAATVHWGAPWRMMTKTEMEALLANCTAEWTSNWEGTGAAGRVVTGKGAYASKSIFFPASRSAKGSSLDASNASGYFWSSTPNTGASDFASVLRVDSGNFTWNNRYRYYGCPVRAVRETLDANRPAAGTGAAIVGGNGGDGNPAGKGAFAVADETGAEVTVVDPMGLVKKGEDGAVSGTAEHPWKVGVEGSEDTVQAYTNGTGKVIVTGEGAPKTFAAGEEPWTGAVPAIKEIIVPSGKVPEFKEKWPGSANLITDGTIPYRDWDYESNVMTDAVCTAYTVVTPETKTFASGGWYVVNSLVTNATGGIVVNGDAHLILCDEARLVVTGAMGAAGIEVHARGAVTNSLAIYGQADGTGSLEATGGRAGAGIGGQENYKGGMVTINGGVIRANGGQFGAGIGGGQRGPDGIVTINGGTVTAIGSMSASGIGCGEEPFGTAGSLTFGSGFKGGVLVGMDAPDEQFLTREDYANEHGAKCVTMPVVALAIPRVNGVVCTVQDGEETIAPRVKDGVAYYVATNHSTLTVGFAIVSGFMIIEDAPVNPLTVDDVTDVRELSLHDLPVVKSKVQAVLEEIFDSANSGTVVSPVCENDVLTSHTVILAKDYGPLAFSNDFGAVTLDLNGWTIKGVNGADGSDTVAGVNGGAAIVVDGTCELGAGATVITVTTTSPMSVPTDADGFDYSTDGLTFVPGDYCVVDLTTGVMTRMDKVTDGSIFNTDEYKTSKIAFRYVPAGKFKAKCGNGFWGFENPSSHDVELSAYWMAIFPITVAQYYTVVGGGDTTNTKAAGAIADWTEFRGGNWSSWDGAYENVPAPGSGTFMDKLNQKASSAGRPLIFDLCTSFQWERAARAGTRTDYYFTAEKTAAEVGRNIWEPLSPYAWYKGNADGVTHTVGGKIPNAWGFYDMYGNVTELCLDTWENLDGKTVGPDYAGPSGSGYYCVARGGSFSTVDGAACCSSICRSDESRTMRVTNQGFRIMLTDASVSATAIAEPGVAKPASGTASMVVGGDGGNGAPAGAGSEAIVDGGGVKVEVADQLGFVKKGKDGISFGSETLPWKIGPQGNEDLAQATTNGHGGLIIEGEGPVVKTPWLDEGVKSEVTEITIENPRTELPDEGFSGMGTDADKIKLILPDDWKGELPDEDGNWYGAKAEIANAPFLVRNLSFRQRYPWNGLVDVTADIMGYDGADLLIRAFNGREELEVGTLYGATDIPFDEGHRAKAHAVWDAREDLGNKFRADAISITVRVISAADRHYNSLMGGLDAADTLRAEMEDYAKRQSGSAYRTVVNEAIAKCQDYANTIIPMRDAVQQAYIASNLVATAVNNEYEAKLANLRADMDKYNADFRAAVEKIREEESGKVVDELQAMLKELEADIDSFEKTLTKYTDKKYTSAVDAAKKELSSIRKDLDNLQVIAAKISSADPKEAEALMAMAKAESSAMKAKLQASKKEFEMNIAQIDAEGK